MTPISDKTLIDKPFDLEKRPDLKGTEPPHKDSKKQSLQLSGLPPELLHLIIGFLDIPDLRSFGLCSKSIKQIVDNGKFYEEILKVIKREFHPRLINTGYGIALPYAMQVQFQLGSLNGLILFTFAKKLNEFGKKFFSKAQKIDDVLRIASQDSALSQPHKIEATLMRIELKDLFPGIRFSYDEAIRACQELTTLNSEQRILTWYFQAKMKFHNHTTLISDEQAFTLFHSVSIAPGTSPEMRMRAVYYRALFKVNNRIQFMTYEQAFDLFDIVSNNLNISYQLRFDATLYKTFLKFQYRITSITHDQAFDLAESVSVHPDSSTRQRLTANFYKAYLGYTRSTTRITDDQTFDLFTEIETNPSSQIQESISAKLYKALFRIENRTTRITDQMAFDLSNHVRLNPLASDAQKTQSESYLNYLRTTGRVRESSQVTELQV